ncbi:hypothetical protein K0J45_02425 [Shewanella alkalitolerans]|nr:hypothetical protein K0J45_02425 [Shewanella alkalitolerans]
MMGTHLKSTSMIQLFQILTNLTPKKCSMSWSKNSKDYSALLK